VLQQAAQNGSSVTHTLDIHIALGKRWLVLADVDFVDPRPAIPPDSINGQILHMTREQLLELKFSRAVLVYVLGRWYKFSELDEDGKFKLLFESEEAQAGASGAGRS